MLNWWKIFLIYPQSGMKPEEISKRQCLHLHNSYAFTISPFSVHQRSQNFILVHAESLIPLKSWHENLDLSLRCIKVFLTDCYPRGIQYSKYKALDWATWSQFQNLHVNICKNLKVLDNKSYRLNFPSFRKEIRRRRKIIHLTNSYWAWLA